MFKKVLSVSLVLIGLVFCQMLEECFALPPIYAREGLSNSERVDELYAYVTAMWPADTIWPQMLNAMTNIANDNDVDAEAAIEKLCTEFSENQYLPVALHETAKLYRLVGKKDKSLQLHQYVIDKWPQHEYVMWSLRDVAFLNIELGNLEAAQAATDKALTGFANNVYIAFVGYEIAYHYQHFKNYEEAKKLYQYVIDRWPEQTDYVRWCQGGLEEIKFALANQAASDSELRAKVESAKSSIAKYDMEAAEAVINELLTKYPKDPRIAELLFEIAEQLQKLGKYEKARQLHQYVVDTWPQHVSAMWSQAGVAICHIGLGNMEDAEAATQKLLADYSGNDRIAETFYHITAEYLRYEYYQQAQELCQRIVDSWPDDKVAPVAQMRIAQCYEKLKDVNNLPESEANLQIEGAYKEVIERYPESTSVAGAATALGWLTFNQARWDDAAHHFQLALDKNPPGAPRPIDILYPLARAYEQTGQPDKAKELYTELLNAQSLGPASIAKIKTRLEELTGASK